MGQNEIKGATIGMSMNRNSNTRPEFDPDKDGLAPTTLDESHATPAPKEIWNAQATDDKIDLALPQRGGLMRWLERWMLAVERPINWAIGAPHVNPFYYTGPVAVFLLGVVFITGLFLVMFFQVGFDSSYVFIARVEHQFLARIVRAAHRYASDALVVVSIIHAFRLFVLNRLRGARWLAWVSGVVMMIPVLLAGITGYWLVWDERALAIVMSFDNIFGRGAASIMNLIAARQKGNDWIYSMIILLAHLALSGLIAAALWTHLARLNRPKWIPNTPWLFGLTAVVLIVSILVPVGMLPKADLTIALGSASGAFPIDLTYLFYLPAAFDPNWNLPWVWIALVAIFIVAGLLPWLPPQKKQTTITIDHAACNGCTVCATDCPYNAITMMPRTDGRPHKFVALEHPDLCVACGICVGSCDSYAISLGNISVENVWRVAQSRIQREPGRPVVLTCERHAAQNTRANQNAIVIALPCVGAAHPDVVGHLRQAGANDVRVIGCPPEDCANREGNTWEEGRLTRKRLPRFKPTFANEPLKLFWRAPNEFTQVLTATRADELERKLSWRNFVPAFALLGIILLAQIWLTNVMFKP